MLTQGLRTWIMIPALFISVSVFAKSKPSPQKRNPNSVLSSDDRMTTRHPDLDIVYKKIIDEIEARARGESRQALRLKKLFADYQQSLRRLRPVWELENRRGQKCEALNILFKKAVRMGRNPDRFRQEVTLSHSCDISAVPGDSQSGSDSIYQTLEMTIAVHQKENCQSFVSCAQPIELVEIDSLTQSSKIPGVPVPAGGMSTSGGE